MAVRSIEFKPSSNIESIGYDEENMSLIVTFKSGTAYSYSKVPSLVADGFSQADSAGQYLNQNIKNQYDYTPLGAPKTE